MNYTELRAAALKYWTDEGGWMTTAQVYDAAFADQDKVKFQLVCSNLVLEGEHLLVRRKNPDGHGLELKVRTKDDPPYVEPVKKPRKKVVELPAIVSSAKPVYVRPGTVAETPPEIRRHEPNTMPVAHHKIVPPPKHTPMAAALANFNRKDLTIEVPPNIAVQQVPYGASGTTGRSKGDAVLPQPKVGATAAPEVLAAHVDTKRQNETMASIEAETVASLEKFIAKETQALPEQVTLERYEAKELPVIPPELKATFDASWQENLKSRDGAQAPTLGGLLDAFLSAAAPLLKGLITDAVVDAITSPGVIEHVKKIINVQVADGVAPEARPVAAKGKTVPPESDHVLASPDRPRHNPEPRTEPRPVLKKVVVIGITKTHHEREVEDEFGDKFNLRVVHIDTNMHQVRQTCSNADSVLLMKDHINHKVNDHLIAYNIPFTNVKGGISKLKEVLAAM